MRILFLTHYFAPEGNAPANRVYEMTRRWVRAGHEVTVLTCAPNVPAGVVYDGYRNRWFQRESIEGVDTCRVWTYLAANRGTVRRIGNYLSYLGSALLALPRVPRPDVVIATSPQFFCGWAGVLASRLLRRPLLLEIRDLWPESIVAVGALTQPRLIAWLERLERAMYRAAAHVVTVGDGYREQLEARGVPAASISVIPNGVDRSRFAGEFRPEAVRAAYGLGDAFVCSYVGTVGLGCGLDVVLRAARLLRERGRRDVRFLVVGDGAVRAELEARARAEGLAEVVFTGRVDKARIPELLAASDACLVHLTRTPLFRSVLPSKIFEAGAMAKPIVLGVEGHAAELVAGAHAGLCIEPENEHELVEAVLRLAGDAALAKELGESAYARLAVPYDSDALAQRYLDRVLELAGGGTRR